MKKITTIILAIIVFIGLPILSLAQENNDINHQADEVFNAEVTKIIEEKEITRENGSLFYQQNLELKGLTDKWKDKVIAYQGVSEMDLIGLSRFKVGDKVVVQKSSAPDSEDQFFITDYVRQDSLYWLIGLFIITILIIGQKKGFKSLLGLIISFLIIIKLMLPQILAGSNPIIVGIIGSLAILTIIIYLSDGFNQKSNLAILSVLISLTITMVLSLIFTNLVNLTGMVQEEATFLLGLGQHVINFKGLLLAGMLIGAVGVLDDVIVGQIETVKQIKEANPNLKNKQVFKMAYQVGNTHLGAIVNTLFLTYTGASLPLMLLFIIKQEPFISFNQVINNEIIATELVRTFVGSIGIALSMPIATFLGAYLLKNKKYGKNKLA